MNELALYAGAGGGLLGSRLLGWRTVCYVENDAYCVEVLKARIRDGYLDDAPIWDDARTFDGRPWRGCVDIVTAGFPCQPWSVAGKREGEADERNLWPDTARIIREVGPRYCFLENVPRLLYTDYFWETIIPNLAAMFRVGAAGTLSACAVGAPHTRNRLWIVADATGDRGFQRRGKRWSGYCSEEGDVYTWWHEPTPARVAYGLADRMVQLRALGNGQVPAVVREAWRLLKERL